MVSDIGSVTKQFTAAGILKLEELGRLKTSDLMSQYLPGVPVDKAGITLHHLLTHTAGLPGGNLGQDEDPVTRDALVSQVLALPLDSKPGEEFQYSNEGYALLGAVIERVSGQGYEAFMSKHLWGPAGMRDTGYLAPAWPAERLPIGYNAEGEPWGRTYRNGWLSDGPGWYLRANGGVHSSLDDLLRWHEALEAGRVLTKESVARLQTGHVSSGGAEKYGYGWGISASRRGGSVVAHNGGNGFFFTDFRRYRDEGVVIIAMSNQPVIPATQLGRREIESLYFGDAAVAIPPTAVSLSAAEKAALIGEYVAADGTVVTIGESEGVMEATSNDPLLFGTLGALSASGGRFKALEDRSLALLQDCARGDFTALHEAFVDGRPLATVEGNQKRIWAQWREEFGEFQAVELLGTGFVQGDPAVTTRLRFARGGPIVRLAWGPRRLLAFMILPVAPPAPLVATSRRWTGNSFFPIWRRNFCSTIFSGGQCFRCSGHSGR